MVCQEVTSESIYHTKRYFETSKDEERVKDMDDKGNQSIEKYVTYMLHSGEPYLVVKGLLHNKSFEDVIEERFDPKILESREKKTQSRNYTCEYCFTNFIKESHHSLHTSICKGVYYAHRHLILIVSFGFLVLLLTCGADPSARLK